MTDSTPSTPAGWYPDPSGGTRSRWWDGTQWTEHFHDPYAVGVQAAELKAPEGTKTNTPWIWLIVLLPLATLIPLGFVNWGGMFDYDFNDPTSVYTSQLAVFLSPGYITAIVLSPVVYGLNALFAYLDWKQLGKNGVPRPFHFAWVFLSSLVYVIGRSVVVKRRTGQGFAPFWAAMATLLIGLIFGIYLMIAMFSGMSEMMWRISQY